jgi:hypothetical protein
VGVTIGVTMGLAMKPLSPALGVSVLLHAGVFALALLLGLHHDRPRAENVSDSGSASFLGETFDVDELLAARAEAATAAAPAEPAAAPSPPARNEAAAAARAPKPVHQPTMAKEPKLRPTPQPSLVPKLSPMTPGETPRISTPVSIATGDAPSAGAQPASSAESGGTRGVVVGVTNLSKAFTKAVTAATESDHYWDGLPLGSAGSAKILIRVDPEGHITGTSIDDEHTVPRAIERLLARTLLLLRNGRFALSSSDAHASSETLLVEVSLSMGQPSENEFEDDPHHTVSLGFEPPTPAQPGKAYFVHASGRRFEAKVSIVPSAE